MLKEDFGPPFLWLSSLLHLLSNHTKQILFMRNLHIHESGFLHKTGNFFRCVSGHAGNLLFPVNIGIAVIVDNDELTVFL